jgi:hypothetical protein
MEITADQIQGLRWLLQPLCQIILYFIRQYQLKRANRASENQTLIAQEQVRIALARETPKAFWFGVAFAVFIVAVLFATAYSSRRLAISA